MTSGDDAAPWTSTDHRRVSGAAIGSATVPLWPLFSWIDRAVVGGAGVAAFADVRVSGRPLTTSTSPTADRRTKPIASPPKDAANASARPIPQAALHDRLTPKCRTRPGGVDRNGDREPADLNENGGS